MFDSDYFALDLSQNTRIKRLHLAQEHQGCFSQKALRSLKLQDSLTSLSFTIWIHSADDELVEADDLGWIAEVPSVFPYPSQIITHFIWCGISDNQSMDLFAARMEELLVKSGRGRCEVLARHVDGEFGTIFA